MSGQVCLHGLLLAKTSNGYLVVSIQAFGNFFLEDRLAPFQEKRDVAMCDVMPGDGGTVIGLEDVHFVFDGNKRQYRNFLNLNI